IGSSWCLSSELPRQRRLRPRRRVPGDPRLRVRSAGEGLHSQHGGEPAVLRRAAHSAVDIWACPRRLLIAHHGLILYNLDVVYEEEKGGVGVMMEKIGGKDCV
ncbi:unnamed protein product, partial [Musa hybrid cultivar]